MSSTDLIVEIPEKMTVEMFTDPKQFSKVIGGIQAKVKEHEPDVTTVAGRKAIASLAHKIARAKTAIDNKGKALTDDWRAKTAAVNEVRGKFTKKLQGLQDQAREPLNKWEATEEARQQAHKDAIEAMRQLASVPHDEGSQGIEGRLNQLKQDNRDFQEFTFEADSLRKELLSSLNDRLAHVREQEARDAELARQQAELKALRAQQAERDRQEQERLAKEKAAAEAKAREEATRIAAEKAAEEARLAAERKAEEARKAATAEAQRKIDEEKQRAEEAIAAAKREAEEKERKRITAEEKARREAEAEKERIRLEQEARAADEAHRKQVNTEAIKSLSSKTTINDEQAEMIVFLISNGDVPNVSIQY